MKFRKHHERNQKPLGGWFHFIPVLVSPFNVETFPRVELKIETRFFTDHFCFTCKFLSLETKLLKFFLKKRK